MKEEIEDGSLPNSLRAKVLSKIEIIRKVIGWGALICSSYFLLVGRFYYIFLLSDSGLHHSMGLEENIAITQGEDLLALIPFLFCLFLSRFLLRRWVPSILFINLGIIIVAYLQYHAGYLAKSYIEECGKAMCGFY